MADLAQPRPGHDRDLRRSRGATWCKRAVIVGFLGLTIAAMSTTGIVLHNHSGRHRAVASYQLTAQTLTNRPAGPVTTRPQGDGARHAYLTGFRAGPGGTRPVNSPGVFGVAFSPSGKVLASAYGDGTVRLWNLATDQVYGPVLQAGSGSQGGVFGVAFSPDGKLLASGGADGTVRLWDPVTGQVVGSALLAGSSVFGVAFSPDGKLLASGGADGTVRLWNLATGRLHGPVLQAGSGSHGGANAVAFSPSGKLLASGGADGTVRLWDPVTGQAVGSPLQAGSSVFGVAFGPDGNLASADVDGSVRVWNAVGSQAAGPDSSGWFIAVASAIALALSVSAVAIIRHEILPARSTGQRT